MHDDEGMHGAGFLSAAGWPGSVGGIAEDDGVDLVRVVILVVDCACGGSGRVAPGATWEKLVPMLAVSEGEGDRRKHGEGEHRGEQDSSGVEGLAAGDVEARRGGNRDSVKQQMVCSWSRSWGRRLAPFLV
jgi:hypothetical protein